MTTTKETTHQMQIKIKKNAYVFVGYQSGSGKVREFLKANEGAWFDVETDHLFHDQYNTAEFRVYDSMISEIRNDARIGKGKCKYCGTMLNAGEACEKYTAEDPHFCGGKITTCIEYGIDWFSAENTYFLKYPQGLPVRGRERLSCDDDRIKIGTYYLEKFPSLDYYRIYNGRQTVNFKFDGEFYFIASGIGYRSAKNLPIPVSIREKMKRAIVDLSLNG